jgi:tripeptide aminopeptidase
MINESRLINSFITMAQIPSISGREGKMRDYLRAQLQERGLEVNEDEAGLALQGEAGNLWVKIPASVEAETILFAAHMDTVGPGEGIQAIIEDGVIKSKGNTILGSDDKAAIAALLEALDVIREKRLPHGPLELLFTVGEEQGLQGAKQFDFTSLKATMAYVLDAGGDPGVIVIQSPCQNEIEYKVYGKPAHAGINPEKGINAIQAAALALSRMPCGRIDEETTCNLGIIQGGTARNIVADYCQIKGEARSLNRSRLDQITQTLKNTFMEEVQRQGARAEVEVKFLYPEIRLDPEDRVVKTANGFSSYRPFEFINDLLGEAFRISRKSFFLDQAHHFPMAYSTVFAAGSFFHFSIGSSRLDSGFHPGYSIYIAQTQLLQVGDFQAPYRQSGILK